MGKIARNQKKYRISGENDCDECPRGSTTYKSSATGFRAKVIEINEEMCT
jgi:hypothetical protein